jgi:hypothetical protein
MRRIFFIIPFTFLSSSWLAGAIPDSLVQRADAVIEGYAIDNYTIDSISEVKKFRCSIVVKEICNEGSAWFGSPMNLMPGDTVRNITYCFSWAFQRLKDSSLHLILLRINSDSAFELIDPWYFARHYTQNIYIEDFCGRHLATSEALLYQYTKVRDTDETELETGFRRDSSVFDTKLKWGKNKTTYFEYKMFDSTGALQHHSKSVYKSRTYVWKSTYHLYCEDGKSCKKRSSYRFISWWRIRFQVWRLFHPRAGRHF